MYDNELIYDVLMFLVFVGLVLGVAYTIREHPQPTEKTIEELRVIDSINREEITKYHESKRIH